MKTQLKQAFKSSWALILAVVIGLSALTVTAATLNPAQSGRSSSVEDSGRKKDVEKSGDGPYNYHGTDNSWGATPMTDSGNGYWYYKHTVGSGQHDFKIEKDNWGTEYNIGTMMSEAGIHYYHDDEHDPGGSNISVWDGDCNSLSEYYIVLFTSENKIGIYASLGHMSERHSTGASLRFTSSNSKSVTESQWMTEMVHFTSSGQEVVVTFGDVENGADFAPGDYYTYVRNYSKWSDDQNIDTGSNKFKYHVKSEGATAPFNYHKYQGVNDDPGTTYSKLTFAAGSYTFKLNQVSWEITEINVTKNTSPLADSVKLSPSTQTVVKSTANGITLTATLSNRVEYSSTGTLTFNFKGAGTNDPDTGGYPDTEVAVTTVDDNSLTATVTFDAPTAAGTYEYYVEVVPTDSNYGNLYSTVNAVVTVTDKMYKYVGGIAKNATGVSSSTPFTGDLPGTVGTNTTESYNFAVYDPADPSSGPLLADNKDFKINKAKCTAGNTQLSKAPLNDGTDDHQGTMVYTVTGISKYGWVKGPFKIEIDPANNEIWATAEIEENTSKYTDPAHPENAKNVRYYFAVDKDYYSFVRASSGTGVRIKYWNSSKDKEYSGGTYKDITNAATLPSSKPTANSNSIWVYRTALWKTVNPDNNNQGDLADLKEFLVYYEDLPITATSFDFAKEGGNTCWDVQSFKDKTDKEGSISLNPNRIYLFTLGGGTINDNGGKGWQRVKAITLDEMFWDKTKMEDTERSYSGTNQVDTRLFNANFVNYNTTYNTGNNTNKAAVSNSFNKYIAKQYSEGYKHPLYMGYIDDSSQLGLDSDESDLGYYIWDNLAMRDSNMNGDTESDIERKERYYHASIWGLVGKKTSPTKEGETGYDVNRVNGWKYGYLMDNKEGIPLPYFNYNVLKSSTGSEDGKLARNINQKARFPMNKSNFKGIETYSYDSSNDYNRYLPAASANNDNVVLTFDASSSGYVTDPAGAGFLGFFPYKKVSSPIPDGNSEYYGYGAEFDVNFYMTSTGYLLDDNNNKQDITFNFSGDDDVWIFIDGNLVLDLGGAHKISAGTINFTDMKVYYKTTARNTDNAVDIHNAWAYSEDEIKTINLGALLPDFNIYDTSKKHTFQMFYMERGANESNCSISFNLPQNSGLRINKRVDVSDVNPGLQTMTNEAANKDSFKFNLQNKTHTGISYSDTEYDAANPKYPQKSANYIVRRIFDSDDNTDQYVLVKKNNTDGSNSYNYINSSEFTSSYGPVPNVNYVLDDTYAEYLLKSTADDDGSGHTSSTDVDEWAVEIGDMDEEHAKTYNTKISGRTSATGDFDLFMAQSAIFENKIPAKSDVKITLSENLDTLDSRGVISNSTPATVSVTTSSRKVTDYYKTTANYINNLTNKIGSDVETFTSGALTLTDIYLEPDASDEKQTNVEANFVSKPLVNTIKIQKAVKAKDGISDVSDPQNYSFSFNLAFSKVLDYDVSQPINSSDFVYKVVTPGSPADTVETRYGLPITFKANQYALIEGVPVGSTYTLTEATKSGFEFVSMSIDGASSTTNGTEGTIAKGTPDPTPATVAFTNKKSATAKLTIKNEIDVSKVNPGLRDATKWAANTDCFDYGLENKLLTTTEDRVGVYDETDPTYPLGTNSSTSVQRIIGSVADPLPGNTMDLTKRDISDYSTKSLLSNTIWLAIKNQASSSASVAEPTLNNSTYVKFPNINYTVNDIYANSAVIGRTGNGRNWKGNMSTGDFIMLHGQTVTFTDKILGNTKVKITQKRGIWGVENTNESTAWEPKTTTTQNQDHWYTTNITIYDEAKGVYVYYDGGTEYTTTAAADTAGNRFIKGLSVENPDTDTLYSSDGNGNAIAEFDFKNRKKATANSNMTVTFINSPVIKPIRIQKDVVADSGNTDEFYFDVKFYGVFGANTVHEGLFNGTANQNYQTVANGYYLYEQLKNLTYNVYKKSDNTLVEPDRTYGTDSNSDGKPDGIRIKGNEYAVIYGVPEDTVYSICEDEALMKPYVFKEASLNRIVSKLSGNKVNEVYDTVELLENYESADIENSPYVWRQYSTPSINSMTAEQRAEAYNRKKVIAYSDDPSDYPASPTDSDLTVNAENVVFVNRIPTTITFKYYDRDVVTGQYEHLASTPTSATITVSDEEKEYAVIPDSQENAGKLDYAKLIKKVINDNKFGPYNLLATYKVYTSQAAAVEGVKNMVYDAATIKEGAETKYSSMYSDEQLAKHFDRFGRVQGQTYNGQPCKVSDGEKWVTYKAYDKESNETDEDKKLKEVEETGATGIIGTDNHKIKNITIWLPQNLRKYTLTVKYATSGSQLETGTGYRKVAKTGTQLTKTDYYFTRLGKKYESTNSNYNDYVNGVSPFLNEFFMTDAYGSEFPTNSIPDEIDGLNFLGWSLDPEGKAIVSTAKNYEYRITNDCTIYAVYDTPENVTAFAATKGCTTTYAEPDYYTDADGNAQIRINTTMNPYNTLTADGNSDTKITKAASFYVYGLDDAIEKAKEKVGSTTTLYASIKAAIDKMIQDCASDETDFKHNVSGLYGTYSIKVNGINYDDNKSKVEGFEYTASHTNSENTSEQLPLTNKDRATFANYFPASGMWNMDFFVFTAMKYEYSEDNAPWIVSDNAVWYNFGNHIVEETGTKERYEEKINDDLPAGSEINVPDKYTVAYIKYFFNDDTTKKIYEYDPNGTFRLGWKDMT